MQNAGLQYGEGVTSVQESPFASAAVQNGPSNSTASLRQFRKKDSADKNATANQESANSSHVARVAPHNHYPHKQNEYFRYPAQYSDYSSPYKEATVKYSEIAEPVIQPIPHLDHLPTSVLSKHKEKEYVDMCNIPQQSHLNKPYADHQFNGQQAYPPDMSMHHQYMHKEPQSSQIHPPYKPESQYIPKEGTFNHQMHPFLKYNIPQSRNYAPLDNSSLTPFQRMDPHLSRSFMAEHHHHIRDFPSEYNPMEQSRMYAAQKQRYYPTPLPPSNSTYPTNYPHRNIATQQYNYPSCNYPRSTQMNSAIGRYPINMERSISPRRTYTENMEIGMNFPPVPQKIQSGYANYPAYAQHYQQRRPPPAVPQDYYHAAQQHPRTHAQYIPNHHHHHHAPEMPENHVASNIRQYLENWAEEEPAGDVAENPKYIPRMSREEANEVYVINASELPQYLENGVPLIASENGQYIFKSNVSIDNTGAIKILDKTGENAADAQERIVSLHIIENPKSDCLVNKPPSLNPEVQPAATINVISANPNLENTQRPFNHGYDRINLAQQVPPTCDSINLSIHHNSPRTTSTSPEKPPGNDQILPYNEVPQNIVLPSSQNRLNFDESLLPNPVPCDSKKKCSDDENSVMSNEEAMLKEELDKIVQDTLTSTNMHLPLESLPKTAEDNANSKIPYCLLLDLDSNPKDLRLTPPDAKGEENETIIDLSTNSRRTSKSDEEISSAPSPTKQKEGNVTKDKSDEEVAKQTENTEEESSAIKHMPLIFDGFEENAVSKADCAETDDKNEDPRTLVTGSNLVKEEKEVEQKLTEENVLQMAENQESPTRGGISEETDAKKAEEIPTINNSQPEPKDPLQPEENETYTTKVTKEEDLNKGNSESNEGTLRDDSEIEEDKTKIEEIPKTEEVKPLKESKDQEEKEEENTEKKLECGEESNAEVTKSRIKRKRIFSVDDIIYRIGPSSLAQTNSDKIEEKNEHTEEPHKVFKENETEKCIPLDSGESKEEICLRKNENLNKEKAVETFEVNNQPAATHVEGNPSTVGSKQEPTQIQEEIINDIKEQPEIDPTKYDEKAEESIFDNETNKTEKPKDNLKVTEENEDNIISTTDEEIKETPTEEEKHQLEESQNENLSEKENSLIERQPEKNPVDEKHETNEKEDVENSPVAAGEEKEENDSVKGGGAEFDTPDEEENPNLSNIEDGKPENLKRSLPESYPTKEDKNEECDATSHKRIKLNDCETPEKIEISKTTITEQETTKTKVKDIEEIKPSRFSVIQSVETPKDVVMSVNNCNEDPITTTSEISVKKEENVVETENGEFAKELENTKLEAQGEDEKPNSEVKEEKIPNEVEANYKITEESTNPKVGETSKDNKKSSKEDKTFEQRFVEPLLKNKSSEAERIDGEVEEEDKTSTEDYQYRSVLKIEENVVLLEICGELVEISVNLMNGKKVITVVPLSNTATVDINDNYENGDRACVDDHIEQSNPVDSGQTETEMTQVYEKTCAEYSEKNVEKTCPILCTQEEEEKVLRNEEITSTQTEMVENTEEIFEDSILNENEIIIGDESLEEEINLDLKNDEMDVEEKPVMCTKAAKKIYEDVPLPVTSKTQTSLREFRKIKTKPEDHGVQQNKESSHSVRVKKFSKNNTRTSRKGNFNQNEESRDAFQELLRQRKMRKEKIRLKYSQYICGDAEIIRDDKLEESLEIGEVTSEKEVRSEVRKVPKMAPNVFKLDQEQVSSVVHKAKGGNDLKRKEQSEFHGTKTKSKDRNRRRSVDDGREKIHLIASVILKEPSSNIDTDKKKTEERPTSTSHLLPDPSASEKEILAQNFQAARPTSDTDLAKNTSVQDRQPKFPKTSVPRDLSLTKNVNEHYLSRKDHSNLKKKLSIQEYNSRKRKMGVAKAPPCAEKVPRLADGPKEAERQRPATIYSGRLFENVSNCVKDPRRLQFLNEGLSRANSSDSTFPRMPNISFSRSLSTGSTSTQSSMTADYLLNRIPPLLKDVMTSEKMFLKLNEPKDIDTTYRRRSLECIDKKYEAPETVRRKVSFDDNVQINEIHTTQPKAVKVRQESNSSYCEVTSSCSDNFEDKPPRNSEDSDEASSRTSVKTTRNDWEDSNSPKDCITDAFAECFLDKNKIETVKNTRNKLIIDINDFNTTSIDNELKNSYKNLSNSSSSNEGSINYKEEVDLKLNSLNIQIPKAAKQRVSNEDDILMHKFLRKEQLSSDEIKQIRRIIYYKKKMQQLQKQQTAPEENYKIKSSPESSTNKNLKLQLKKVDGKVRKKKKRFRNLYSNSPETSDNEVQETAGEFSVYEGENISGVKLIFKRKTDLLNLQPVVRLQRCKQLDTMAKKLKFE